MNDYPAKVDSVSLNDLAAPFNEFFSSVDEARWGFEQIHEALKILLGIDTMPDADPRLCLGIIQKGKCLTLQFNRAIILQFHSHVKGRKDVEFLCSTAAAEAAKQRKEGKIGWVFTNDKKPMGYVLFKSQFEYLKRLVQTPNNGYKQALVEGVARRGDINIADKEAKFHKEKMLQMVYDSELRDWYLRNGLDKPYVPASAVVLGMEYSLKDLGGASSGAHLQRIATPVGQLFVDLFTEENSDPFGIKDVFRDDGVFVYTGERQINYAELEGVNLAVRDSARDGKQLRLFERTKEGKARFVGYAAYLSHHIDETPDATGELRSAILFELEVSAQVNRSTHVGVNAGVGSLSAPDLSAVNTLADLRVAALLPSPSGSTPKQRRSFVYYRSKAVKKYVWMRANGKCEGCQKSAPFVNRRQEAFLEPHHTTRLADGGPDHPAHVIALCPNCHREVHHGADGEKLNKEFIDWLRKKENVS